MGAGRNAAGNCRVSPCGGTEAASLGIRLSGLADARPPADLCHGGHGGNVFQDKVPAGFAVGNGFGKFAGATQVSELGEVETPLVARG